MRHASSSIRWDDFAGPLPDVRVMGKTLFDPIWARRTHASPACELHYVVRGQVTVTLGRQRLHAGPGDVLLIPSGAPHRDVFDVAQGLEVFMVFFSWAAERAYFARVRPHLTLALSPVARREIARMFARLQADCGGGDEADRLVARARVLTILLVLLREAWRRRAGRRGERRAVYGQRRRQDLMLRAKAYLEQHLAEPITLDGMAAALRVSPFYLSHVFSEQSDFSLFAFLTALRMNQARVLLQEGRLNVAEIARAVGYDDANYFAKVFRRHCGAPPTRWR